MGEILRKEFDVGKKDDPLDEAIVTFLETNKEKAFQVYKIEEALHIPISEGNFWESVILMGVLIRALERLEKEGRIISKTISWTVYYTVP